jgi:hypothetical protein
LVLGLGLGGWGPSSILFIHFNFFYIRVFLITLKKGIGFGLGGCFFLRFFLLIKKSEIWFWFGSSFFPFEGFFLWSSKREFVFLGLFSS